MIIYGPVPSWRLGNSLGVDIVEALGKHDKICSFDCLYCQLGHDTLRTDQPRKIDISDIDFELLRKRIAETKPDYVTFSGRGEPTLNLNLGYAAKRIKQMTDIPVTVLTNASLINNPDVMEGLNYCDLVIAKIDAPNQDLFERVNQPYQGISLADIIEGIKLLKTRVAIQTLLFSYNGLTNSDNDTIKEMIEVYSDINSSKPISIFLGTAYRPTGKERISPISEERIKEIALKINTETNIKVVYYNNLEPKTISRRLEPSELGAEIFELLRRRPCTQKEITTRFGDVDVSGILSSLVNGGRLQEKTSNGKTFYFWRLKNEI